jgi:molecular chaperone DnaJ
LEIELSFEEAALGTRKTLNYNRLDECNDCNGSGVSYGKKMQICSSCKGSGQEIRSRGGFFIYNTCRSCKGAGRFNPDPCDKCHGNGSRQNSVSVEAQVPSGVSELYQLKIPGQGNFKNGKRGNLLIRFKVQYRFLMENIASCLGFQK